MVEARQHQNRSERGSRFILGSQRSHCHDKTSSGVVDSSEGVGWKGRMSSTTDMYRSRILKGAEIGRLGGYGFRGTVTVGDGSNHKGGNGSRLCESAGGKEKAAEEGEMRRGRIQLEPCGTSGLCTGITRHSFDKTHALFVRQPSAVESYEKIGRRR